MNMEISVVKIGGPFIWQSLCMMESVSSLIHLEEDAIEKLNSHIQKLEDALVVLTNDMEISTTGCIAKKDEMKRLKSSLCFFRALRNRKRTIINLCLQVNINLKEQISDVITEQESIQFQNES